ncbi:MAG: hypothetical protein QXI17_04060 [Candidatus Bilamarchaeaceae archaeon]
MATPSIVSVSGQKEVIKKEPNVVFYSVDSLTKKQLEKLKNDYHIAKFSFYTKEGNIFIKKDYYFLVKKDYSGDIDEAVHSFLKSKVESYKKLAPKKEEPSPKKEEPKKEELSQQPPLEPLVPSKKEEHSPKKEEQQGGERMDMFGRIVPPSSGPVHIDLRDLSLDIKDIGASIRPSLQEEKEKEKYLKKIYTTKGDRVISKEGVTFKIGENKCEVIKDKNNIPHLFFVSSFTTKDNGTVTTFNPPTINEKSIEDNRYGRIPIQIEENGKKQIIAYIRIGKSFCVNSEEKEKGIYRLNDEAINFIIAKLQENIDKKYHKYLDQVRENILKNIKIKK